MLQTGCVQANLGGICLRLRDRESGFSRPACLPGSSQGSPGSIPRRGSSLKLGLERFAVQQEQRLACLHSLALQNENFEDTASQLGGYTVYHRLNCTGSL